MNDFLRFLRQLWIVIHFLRGVVLSLLLLLLVCAITVSISEGMPLRTAVYFILVTALTIGYGDITPVTPLGRITSVAAGIIGIVCTGIVIAASVRSLERAYRDVPKPDEQEGS